jgi:hypothetical protein
MMKATALTSGVQRVLVHDVEAIKMDCVATGQKACDTDDADAKMKKKQEVEQELVATKQKSQDEKAATTIHQYQYQ